MTTGFLFATGIENSAPTIQNGTIRVDEMEKCGHYKYWKKDFELLNDIGISVLRYGPPIHLTFIAPGKYNWSFCDTVFNELYSRNILPIVDLCHFGVPGWIGNFQNPDFPDLFAAYAKSFAIRYPWIQLYTPVNEMYICALFSAKYGWWNEQLTDDKAFVTALKHVVKANVLAMREILSIRKDAIFVQSESSEYYHAANPSSIGPAQIKNEERFLSLDLNYGKRVNSDMYEYLMSNGMTKKEYHFFLENTNLRHYCIMGNDYYITNEHRVYPNGGTEPSGEIFGYHVITMQYYDRYKLPVMHTETNLNQGANGNEAVKWLHKEWANVLQVRNQGVPIVGFTWYSLTDQVDWDVALRFNNGTENPLGLFDLNRNIRPVGKAYKELIAAWKDVLPVQSICLQLPVVMLQAKTESIIKH